MYICTKRFQAAKNLCTQTVRHSLLCRRFNAFRILSHILSQHDNTTTPFKTRDKQSLRNCLAGDARDADANGVTKNDSNDQHLLEGELESLASNLRAHLAAAEQGAEKCLAALRASGVIEVTEEHLVQERLLVFVIIIIIIIISIIIIINIIITIILTIISSINSIISSIISSIIPNIKSSIITNIITNIITSIAVVVIIVIIITTVMV